jgi:hypothetical protein
MEEETNKPSKGTWGRLGNTESSPKVTFDVNIPQTVTFLSDEPEERDSQDGGVYYVFNVKHNNEEKTISTSAWTLLGALKEQAPLKEKTLVIVKKLIKGKQKFEVTSVAV